MQRKDDVDLQPAMKSLKRLIPDPDRIREIKSLRFLGQRIYSPNLWHFNRQSVSRAFAVGLWAMYTPPLPIQQVVAAIGAIYFGANLPIAVALVWITNPLTWLPMYYFAYEVGALALGTEAFSFEQFSARFDINQALSFGAPLLLGCVILMHLGALLGYFGVQGLWIHGVKKAAQLRRLRTGPFDSADLVQSTHSRYMQFLKSQKHTVVQTLNQKKGNS